MDFQLDSYTSLKTIYGIDTNLKIFYSDNLSAVRVMHWYLLQPFLFHASEGFDSTLAHVFFDIEHTFKLFDILLLYFSDIIMY